MKKNYILILSALLGLQAGAIDKGVYAEIPETFPEAFNWQMVRTDYRGTDDAGAPVAVNEATVEVQWEPEYQNGSACYGRLTVINFFDDPCVQNACDIEFTNENNRNFQVSEDGKTITFSFTGYYFSPASTDAEYSNAYGKLSKSALVAAAKKGTDSRTSRYWYSGEYVQYAYNGGVACNCVLDLENQTITIDQPWGAFMCADRYGAPSSYVIQYYERSEFVATSLTAVDDIHAAQPASYDPYYYTIGGQRTLNPTPGFYIHNGQKMIVK